MSDRGGRTAVATCLAAALALTGCAGEDPAPAAFDRAWTVPDDVCDRLDLPTLLGQFDGAAVANPKARHEDSPTQCLVHAGDITGNVVVQVSFDVADDRPAFDLAWDNAVAQIVPSSVWESLGAVDTATPQAASWPDTSYARRFTSVQSGALDGQPDTTRVAYEAALGDANVVISVGVVSTSAAPSDEVVGLTDRVAQAVTAALSDGVLEPAG